MNKFKDLLSEIRMTVSADYKVSPSGRKVHKMKKIADVPGDTDGDGDVDADDKKVTREQLEQIDEVTYYDGSDMLGEANRSSSSYQFTHKPGDSESEKKLSDLKKSVKGTGKRVVLMGRLGKDNPNSAKYRKGGEVTKQRGPFMGTHQYIRKGDAGHHDVYVYNRRESVEESIVPDRMKSKQKPYVSSDGKGNYEVLGNTGQTKAEFSRGEHGSMAHGKAQAHLKSKYDEYMKEEVELEEAVDKREQRFLMLARLGLVQKSEVSKLRIALDLIKADKPLSIAQRNLLLSVMGDLISLVTGDDTVFNRVKMDVQKESVEDLDENTEKLQEQHYVLAHSRVRGGSSPVKDINGKIKTHDTEDDAKKHAEELNKRTSSSNIYYTYGGKRDESNLALNGKDLHEEIDAVQSLENSLNEPDGYGAIDQMMQSISKDCGITPKELHNKFVQKHGKTPDEYAQGVKEACWDSHKQVGMKKKGDKMVPNCVPKESVKEGRMKDIVTNAQETDRLKKKEVVPFDGPYTKVSSSTTDKSGAKHTPMSAAKHLARLALKKQLDKNKE